MKRLLVAVVALAIVVAVGVVVGQRLWNRYQLRRTVDPSTPLADQCDQVPANASRITLTASDGRTLGAALVGPDDATVGVVFRQGASQRICEWLPWAGQVASDTGARILLFDRRGRGSSPGEGDLTKEPDDTLVAVRALRHTGVRRVALVASSMGNSIMFSALPSVRPAPCAVVSISPVLVSGDAHGTVNATALKRLPQNLWVTWETGNAGIDDNAKLILSRAGDEGLKDFRQLPVDTTDHSRQLILNHPEAADFVTQAIESCR
ncbi:MAG: hypothetical protein QM714_18915 [Nocardioides sp.]|uniref:alpha/beta hydrolase n=1 Tax=Nocardioides sp. TaxID=35761 RepID=UPI0039E452B7